MKFYTKQHNYYCGIDLHARTMYVCILDSNGQGVLHANMKANPKAFAKAIKPFQDELCIAVECMFTWYWVADFCEDNNIPFVLGHALYMNAIHGGKAKNDKIESSTYRRRWPLLLPDALLERTLPRFRAR